MRVEFWGTRGSLASPGPHTVRYGGNTSCVRVEAAGHTVVFDAGSGLAPLGEALPRDGRGLHLFFSHYHWDHVVGLPFFAPLFEPGRRVTLHGEGKGGKCVEALVSELMATPFFPEVTFSADVRFAPVAPGSVVDLGGLVVRAGRLRHPQDALAYRVEAGGAAVVYATDFEHGPGADEELIELARGADLLIYDSTYSPEEYPAHRGWGHSTWEAGASIARRAGVDRLVLFHHAPGRVDEEVAALEAAARAAFPGAVAAREGMAIELGAWSAAGTVRGAALRVAGG